MNPLHATIEEFAADGYTHIECFCPRCRVIRLRPMSWLPRISMDSRSMHSLADYGAPSAAARCKSVMPWRQADVLGKPEGREDSGLPLRCCPMVTVFQPFAPYNWVRQRTWGCAMKDRPTLEKPVELDPTKLLGLSQVAKVSAGPTANAQLLNKIGPEGPPPTVPPPPARQVAEQDRRRSATMTGARVSWHRTCST